MSATAKFLNIQIDYGEQYSVAGAQSIHAMRTDEPGTTVCGRRPLRYTVTDHASQSTTCEKCREALDVPTPAPTPPKSRRVSASASPEVKRQVRREKRQESRRRQFALDDPEVQRQLKQTKGLSRCWQLTEKGLAALAYWDEIERLAGK